MRTQRRGDRFNAWLRDRLGDRVEVGWLAPNVKVFANTTRHPLWTHPWYALRNRYRNGWRTIERHRVGGSVVCIIATVMRDDPLDDRPKPLDVSDTTS